MSPYTIEVKGLDETITRLKGAPQVIARHHRSAMLKSVVTLTNNIKPLVPVGVSGNLRNSIGYEIIDNIGSQIVGKVGSSLKAEEYPATMEYGRKPGSFPPVDSLVRWVRLKLGVPESEARGVAFTVARKIARSGIPGKFFMKQGIEKSKTAIMGFFNKAAADIARELNNGH
jgi:hypothetical protein